jgi:hypothetical protein
MVGVITNSKDWIFTRYDMKAEAEGAKFGFENEKKRFEYSQKFEIFHLDKRTNSIEIKYTELAQVVFLLENLNVYYVGIK